MQLPTQLWYPLLESRELGARPLGLERLGRRFVFWRTADGKVRAHPERCPHLGAALSGGEVKGDRLVCPFHGFEFGTDGTCRHIPAYGRNGRIPAGLALTSYEVREAHGMIWLWWGAPQASYPDPPFFAELQRPWRYGTTCVDWPVHYTRAIENQLDVAHIPFVHANTIGRGGRAFVEGPYVQAEEADIRVWTRNRLDDGTPARELEELGREVTAHPPQLWLRMPGVWLLDISPSMKNVLFFVPINERMTRYYVRAYHRIGNPVLAWFFERMLALSNRYILRQDLRVIVHQTPARSDEATADRLIAADRAIVQYRRLHARLLAASQDPPS